MSETQILKSIIKVQENQLRSKDEEIEKLNAKINKMQKALGDIYKAYKEYDM